jgi:hypothetical protein
MMNSDRLLSVLSEIGKNAAALRGCGQLARVTAYAIRDMLPPRPDPIASAFVAYAEDYAMTVHYHAALVHAEDIGRWSIGHSAINPSLAIAEASHARTHAAAQLLAAWKELTAELSPA